MRRMINKNGEPIYKSVFLKVFATDNKHYQRQTLKAPPDRGFTAENIQAILEQAAKRIEDHCKTHYYRLVELGPNIFNFVCEGPREIPEQRADGVRAAEN